MFDVLEKRGEEAVSSVCIAYLPLETTNTDLNTIAGNTSPDRIVLVQAIVDMESYRGINVSPDVEMDLSDLGIENSSIGNAVTIRIPCTSY